jgi:hypothetical protein
MVAPLPHPWQPSDEKKKGAMDERLIDLKKRCCVLKAVNKILCCFLNVKFF